jgi:type II secretory pathway pseudopilin PulG
MKPILGDSRGMTIAEVLVALGVIMVGLLALIATMPMSTSTITQANLKTTATFLAQQRLEQIKNAQWCFSCGAGGGAVDTLCGTGLNGTAACLQWPDEAYDTIAIPAGSACPTTDTSVSCYPRFRRQTRIIDCSVVSCSGIAIGTATVSTLRQVTVTVWFVPLAATVARDVSDTTTVSTTADLGEEAVQLVTLITRRS